MPIGKSSEPCVARQREVALGPRREIQQIRSYLSAVYPRADIASLTDGRVLSFFTSRQWFYGGTNSSRFGGSNGGSGDEGDAGEVEKDLPLPSLGLYPQLPSTTGISLVLDDSVCGS